MRYPFRTYQLIAVHNIPKIANNARMLNRNCKILQQTWK